MSHRKAKEGNNGKKGGYYNKGKKEVELRKHVAFWELLRRSTWQDFAWVFARLEAMFGMIYTVQQIR